MIPPRIPPRFPTMIRWSLATFALGAGLAVSAPPTPARAQPGVSAAVCESDFQAMLAAIAANRDSAIAEIDRQIAETGPDKHPALIAIKESAWMREEHERVQADRFRRDCLKAAGASN